MLPIPGVTITSKMDTGLTFTDGDGTPLRLALVGDNNEVYVTGEEVAKAVFSTVIETHEQFWRGKGHLNTINGGSQ